MSTTSGYLGLLGDDYPAAAVSPADAGLPSAGRSDFDDPTIGNGYFGGDAQTWDRSWVYRYVLQRS